MPPAPWAELTGPGGHAFRFRIVAYEFPGHVPRHEHDYDANWLRVDAVATDGVETWEWNRYAAWLTWDLPRLRDWFAAVLEKHDQGIDWCSLEPLVTFTVTADGVMADVDCGIHGDEREKHTVHLQPTDDELRVAVVVVDAAMREFPPR